MGRVAPLGAGLQEAAQSKRNPMTISAQHSKVTQLLRPRRSHTQSREVCTLPLQVHTIPVADGDDVWAFVQGHQAALLLH